MNCNWEGHESCNRQRNLILIEGHGHYCLEHIKELAWMYLDCQD